MMIEKYTMGKELDLKKEQEVTLRSHKLSSNFVLQLMFIGMDLIYGSKRTLQKFRVIELLARYPYIAWEHRAYMLISKSSLTRNSFLNDENEENIRLINLGRAAQDNEQWHLMIIDDLLRQEGYKSSWFKDHCLSSCLAFIYCYFTKILYFFSPSLSYSMNAKFESHAEHEYMNIVKENPDWESTPVETLYFKYYPKQKNKADLFRRIGLDERDHKNESLEECGFNFHID